MSFSTLRQMAVILLALLPGSLAGQSIVYELREGSYLLDECPICALMPITIPLEGTFTLTPRPGQAEEQLYDVADLSFTGVPGGLRVEGAGTFTARVASPPTGRLELRISVDGGPEVSLDTGTVDLVEPWPILELRAIQLDPTPAKAYSLRLAAAPRTEMAPFVLSEDSWFAVDCVRCGPQVVPIPIAGSFLMGKVLEAPPLAVYRIDRLDFVDAAGKGILGIAGIGSCRMVDSGKTSQVMAVQVNITSPEAVIPALLVSGNDPAAVPLPDLTISLRDPIPSAQLRVFTVFISVRSKAPPAGFRRGDGNDDGDVDISDAVYVLSWLFGGGESPGCLASLDASADTTIDLTDAIAILGYLFLGADAPPAPGPLTCGGDPGATPGCSQYLSCSPTAL